MKPTNSTYKDGHFGIRGIHLYCSITQRPQRCLAGFFIDAGEPSSSQALFDILVSHKEDIESKVSVPLKWANSDQKRSCSINASIEGNYLNQDEWPVLASFQAKICKELAQFAFYPYENELRAALQE